MRNDFFKYILLRASSTDTAELESETLPYAFKSNGGRLRNYRIYGNTINHTNLFAGVEFTDNAYISANGSEMPSGGTLALKHSDFISISENTSYTLKFTAITLKTPNSNTISFCFFDENKEILSYRPTKNVSSGDTVEWSNISPENAKYLIINTVSASDTLNLYATYESTGVGDYDSTTNKYIIPVVMNGTAVNISLDSPLANGDYIDFLEQKRFNADNSTKIILLPVLPVANGINVLDIDTENQPSKVYIQGNVSSFSVSSWENVQRLVRAGLHDKYFAIGDQLVCQKGGSDLTWDIIGFDHDTPTDTQYTHSMTLQLHDCLPDTMVYDTREALYYAENGLVSGRTYNFTVPSGYDEIYGGNKTYQFEIPNDITVGAGSHLVVDWSSTTQANNAKINIYASATSETPVNANPISISEGNAGTSLGTADGNSTNLNFIGNARFGNNNYSESAIRQFLNSDKSTGYVWKSQSIFDRPPSWNADTAGFMKDIDNDFLAVVGTSNKSTISIDDTASEASSVTLNDKFFLLSRSEVYGGNEISTVDDGSPYPYYSDYSDSSTAGIGSDTNRVKYRNGIAQVWWLRTPILSSKNVRLVNASGRVTNSVANSKYGVVPACCII
jgi:hypothetical protein